MRQECLVPSLLRRVSQPANLAMVGLVGGLFCLFQVLTRPVVSPADGMLPFILLFGHLALAPMPWQWTFGAADRPGLVRGFAQALVFDALWIGLVLAALHLLSGPGPGHPPPPMGPFPTQPPPLPPGPRPWHPFRPGLVLGLGLVNLAFGLAYGWVVAEKEATEARERATAGLLRQAQAQALQHQLEPHVLYNALNGLSELVHEDPLAAEEVIGQLADLYRTLTHHGEAGQVRLGEERRLVEAYLDMEQMRLGERLQVRWTWPSWADALVLPPFFLLPLVENAVKHGISPAEAGGQVAISCDRDGRAVRLRVENTGSPLRGQPRGVGLGNLEARLGLWPELEGAFTLGTRDGWTTASVRWVPEAP